jgi:hypothetical protein
MHVIISLFSFDGCRVYGSISAPWSQPTPTVRWIRWTGRASGVGLSNRSDGASNAASREEPPQSSCGTANLQVGKLQRSGKVCKRSAAQCMTECGPSAQDVDCF